MGAGAIDKRIGFMQGRLSPPVGGRIQAFPWDNWEQEFRDAGGVPLSLMEWTLDQDRLRENPLMTAVGQERIRTLSGEHGLRVGSITGDCFMQAPFWKTATPGARAALQKDFLAIVDAAGKTGASLIVVPLVDAGALAGPDEEDLLVEWLLAHEPVFQSARVRIVFESDCDPASLSRFLARLPGPSFGVNYDIGNSAACGFDPIDEITGYGARILNVHVKDRVRGGTTVPLGEGDADFPVTFGELRRIGYGGNYIMQTARARDGDHLGALKRYLSMIREWLQA